MVNIPLLCEFLMKVENIFLDIFGGDTNEH